MLQNHQLVACNACHRLVDLSGLLYSGFPGETEQQHRELVDFAKQFKFERMGCFAYSEEDGTPAAEMPEQVPPKLRQVGYA